MFEEQEFKKILLLIKTCMVISIIAAVFVICTHWRGFHFSITPPVTPDTTRVVVVERPAPVHQRKTRLVTVAPDEDETEEEMLSSYQPPPRLHVRPLPRVNSVNTGVDIETGGSNIQADRPPGSPLFTEAPTADFSVTVHSKKHRWPRRFFGAMGHGFRKVVTFGH